MIKKYIKRPYVIEAVQWGGSNYTKDRHNWIFNSGNVRFDEFEPGVLIEQEKELEKSEWVCVKKDRLENLIEHSYETSCPLVDYSACHLNGPHFTCSDCEFNYDSLDDDSELPVKNVIKWLEGKENEQRREKRMD
ncbi:hypothetical protein AAK706_01575 [Erysipelotrichaceae bacterium 66-17]